MEHERYTSEDADCARILQEELDTLRHEHHIPGMSVAVVRCQKVILACGFGYADLENQVPATADTPYNIASCTKPVAATVLMRLVEEGSLDLDAPMTELLENAEFNFVWEGARVRGYAQMCAAVSELAAMDDIPLASLFRDYRCDRETITVRHHLTHTAQGTPGQVYRYNGFLYGWLSLVAEKAVGMPLPTWWSIRSLARSRWRTRCRTRTLPRKRGSWRSAASTIASIRRAAMSARNGPRASLPR